MNTSKNHDNIDEIYKKIWDCLKLGIKESKSDYHTFSLATSDEKLSYNRTVVLLSLIHISEPTSLLSIEDGGVWV